MPIGNAVAARRVARGRGRRQWCGRASSIALGLGPEPAVESATVAVGSRKHFVSGRAAAVVAERLWNRKHGPVATALVARFNGVAVGEGSTGA
jgi:hypothetical protein